jgi:Tol biopolymer transport system component
MAGHRVGTVPLPPGHYEYVRISPDGTQAAIVRSISPAESTLWAVDLARGGMTPLSSGPGRNDVAIWSPDGSKVVFTADRDGAADFFVKTVGDATPEQPLFRSPAVFKGPNAWTADGGWIIMTEIDPSTSQNVALLPAGGARDATPLVQGPTRDIGGPVSPDGRWLAYFSDQTGRFQLYVQSFPGPGRRVQVSQNGAVAASWSRDGRELLFLGDNTRSVWRVSVTPGATFSAGAPTLVVDLPPNILALDVSPDHQRILALAPEQTGTGTMTVVLNWRASLAQRQ